MTEQEAKRAFAFIFCTRLIDSVGFGMIMPVMPTLLMDVGQMSLAEATRAGGLLLVTYSFLQFLFGPLMGGLSDRFGRRPIIFAALAALAIDYTVMAAAPTLAVLFIGRAIAGMAGAVYAPANAFAADVTPPDRRAAAFGRLGAAFGVGFIVGPALGGLASEFGPRAPFVLAAVLSAANLVFGFFVLPESLPAERRRPLSLARANPLGGLLALRRYTGVLGVIFSFFIFQMAFNVYPSTWAYYAEAKFGWDGKTIGLSLMLTGVFMFLIQYMGTGWIAGRLGDRGTAMLAMTVAILGCVTYAFIPLGWMVFLVQPLVSPQALVFPMQNTILSKRVAANEQGALQGTMGSMNSLGSVIGPLVLTQTLSRFTEPGASIYFPGAAFLLAAALMTLGLAGLILATAREARAVTAAGE